MARCVATDALSTFVTRVYAKNPSGNGDGQETDRALAVAWSETDEVSDHAFRCP